MIDDEDKAATRLGLSLSGHCPVRISDYLVIVMSNEPVMMRAPRFTWMKTR